MTERLGLLSTLLFSFYTPRFYSQQFSCVPARFCLSYHVQLPVLSASILPPFKVKEASCKMQVIMDPLVFFFSRLLITIAVPLKNATYSLWSMH